MSSDLVASSRLPHAKVKSIRSLLRLRAVMPEEAVLEGVSLSRNTVFCIPNPEHSYSIQERKFAFSRFAVL